MDGLCRHNEINKFASFLLRYQPGAARTLPLISPFARDVRAKSSQGRYSTAELTMAFETDPFLSAKLLSEANSIAFNRQHRTVHTLREAFDTVGADHAFKILCDAPQLGFDSARIDRKLYELWTRWITVAYASQVLSFYASATTLHPDTMFVVGLVHDIGHLLELHYDPGRLASIARKQGSREHVVGTLSHTALGESLARAWALPESMVHAIRWHHSPEQCRVPAGRVMAALVFLADKLAGCCLSERALDVESCGPALAIVGIKEKHLHDVENFFRKVPYVRTQHVTAKRSIDTLGFFKSMKNTYSQYVMEA